MVEIESVLVYAWFGFMFVNWKNAQCESYELNFIWGKIRTIAWETASQIALRNCSEEVGRKVNLYVILVKKVNPSLKLYVCS